MKAAVEAYVVTRRSGNLPHEPGLIGRRRELSQAAKLLGRTRLLTLTGAAGVGKTRLALRVADEVRGSCPDGVWLVELAALGDESLVPQTVADALGLRDQARPRPADMLDGYLRDKQALLVLDNCEHLLDACARLADRLLRSAPWLRVLATSRQPLRLDGEAVLRVPPLSVPEPDPRHSPQRVARSEAVQLFAARAGAAVPGFTLGAANREAVAGICRRLDGLPLAIELAVTTLRTLTPEQLLRRLDEHIEHIEHIDPAADQQAATRSRYETLRAALDWSFELCAPGERALWARVSVFAGSFDLEAAEGVCADDGIARTDVFDLVDGLVDKSVLIREESGPRVRYRLLETIRQYGRERLARYGQQTALQRRHRDRYRRLAQQAERDWLSPRQEEWLARLRREHPNLRAALAFCCAEPGEAPQALETAAALWPHWLCSGALSEGRHWLDHALALAPEDRAVRGKALWVDGWLATLQGDTAAAAPRLKECQALGLRLGHTPTLVRYAQYRGGLALYEGDFPRAMELLQEALAGHRAADDRNGVMTTLYLLTLACALYGDQRAAAFGEECLAMCEAAGAQWSRSYAQCALGLHLWRQGATERAAGLVRDALRTRRAVRDEWGQALCLESLAWTAAASGRPEQGARLLGSAEAMWRSVGTSRSGFQHLSAGHEETEARLRAELGSQAYATAFRQGAALPPDRAVAQALHQGGSRTAPSAAG